MKTFKKIKKNKKIVTLIFFFCFGSLTCVIDVEVVFLAISLSIENLIFTLMINAHYCLSFNVFL